MLNCSQKKLYAYPIIRTSIQTTYILYTLHILYFSVLFIERKKNEKTIQKVLNLVSYLCANNLSKAKLSLLRTFFIYNEIIIIIENFFLSIFRNVCRLLFLLFVVCNFVRMRTNNYYTNIL